MRSPDNQSGYSLLELLVASAIFFTFMVGVASIYAQGHATFRRGMSRIEVQQSARIAVESMVREIRLAGYDPSGIIASLPADAVVQVAARDTFTMIADVDGDAVTDQVTYRMVGSQIVREVAPWSGLAFDAPATDQVADGVAWLAFSYFDDSDPNAMALPVDATDLGDIRRISIELVTSFASAGVLENYPLTMDVGIRNAE